MSDFKRFFSIDVIIVGIVCILALIVLIINGSYLPAMLGLAIILCAAIARSYEITVEDSEAVIIQMSEKNLSSRQKTPNFRRRTVTSIQSNYRSNGTGRQKRQTAPGPSPSLRKI